MSIYFNIDDISCCWWKLGTNSTSNGNKIFVCSHGLKKLHVNDQAFHWTRLLVNFFVCKLENVKRIWCLRRLLYIEYLSSFINFSHRTSKLFKQVSNFSWIKLNNTLTFPNLDKEEFYRLLLIHFFLLYKLFLISHKIFLKDIFYI